MEEEDELPPKLALQDDTTADSSAHSIPSTDGISSLYHPNLFVVLFAENVISSDVIGDVALNLQSSFTSTPDNRANPNYN